jgi:Na+-driven multidrug efflux pump
LDCSRRFPFAFLRRAAREKPLDAQEALRHGTALALLFGMFVALAAFVALPFLGRLGQPSEVIALSSNYIVIFAISLIPALLSLAWKITPMPSTIRGPRFGFFWAAFS